MKSYRRLLTLCAIFAVVGVGTSSTQAADAPNPAAKKEASKDLVLRGDAKCTRCHDEGDDYPVLSIGKTKHGVNADARTPTCTSCHGDSESHIHRPANASEQPKPDRVFGKMTKTSVQDRNGACLSCHQTDVNRMHWSGSAHQARDVACTSCHQIHTAHDKVRDKRAQPEVCFTCHKEQRALSNKPSHHPIPEGKMGCSDCHNPHGTMGQKLLVRDTVNDTCFQCHAEKRGPYLWSHQPVTDDCTLCHNPHGTTADYMLKTRPPFLCLSCHDPNSHLGNIPGVSSRVNTSKNTTGTSLGGTTPSDNWNTNTAVGKTQGLSCMNCHPDIHGSNNPANSTNAMHFWR